MSTTQSAMSITTAGRFEAKARRTPPCRSKWALRAWGRIRVAVAVDLRSRSSADVEIRSLLLYSLRFNNFLFFTLSHPQVPRPWCFNLSLSHSRILRSRVSLQLYSPRPHFQKSHPKTKQSLPSQPLPDNKLNPITKNPKSTIFPSLSIAS